MVADSPYEASELAVPPAAGAASGGVAAILMLGVTHVLAPVSGLDVGSVAESAGGVLRAGMAGGLGVVVATGAVLGVLHALSQEIVPPRGLLFCGAMYGLVLWAVGGVILRVVVPSASGLAHAWAWLAACLAYGAVLGVVAVVAARRRPVARTAVD